MEKQRDNIIRIIFQKIVPVLPPSILILSNIFLFGPHTIYQGNIDEFVISLTSILSNFLFPALILVSILCAIGLLLPKELHRRYISILFMLGILIWLQGNVLVWKYGLLDGQGIDWNKNIWRGWMDGTTWVVCLTLTFLFYKKIYKIVSFASIVLISLQTVLFVFNSVQAPEIWKGKEKYSLPISPPKEIFEFSSKQNIIHILLDGFQSDIFHEIIDEDVDFYYSALEGFTFFKETTGSFPTTYLSVPAFLSGQIYKNNVPMPEFVNIVITGKTITNVMYDNGYELDYAGNLVNLYNKGRYTNTYYVPIPYGVTKQQYEQARAASMLDLVLFRHAPQFLKIIIYNNQLWLFQRLLSPPKGHYFAHKAFLQDVIDNISIKRNKPLYKYMHLLQPHSPFVVNEDGEYAREVLQRNRKNAKFQSKYALNHVIELLNKLKKLGIYDSSLIILHADHGAAVPVKKMNLNNPLDGDFPNNKEYLDKSLFAKLVRSATPLMVFKPPYRKGPLKISSAPVMLSDIPDTISSILNINENFGGRSIFEIDPIEVRKRNYYHHKWRNENWQDDFLNRIDEYIIEGSVFDRASWRLGITYYSPELMDSDKTDGF